MIISEKQIMQLIQIANNAMAHYVQNGYRESGVSIAALLDAINNQQCEELKEIE